MSIKLRGSYNRSRNLGFLEIKGQTNNNKSDKLIEAKIRASHYEGPGRS